MPKKQKKPKRTSAKYKLYDGAKRKNKFCPKCGVGVFLAKHNNRETCGRCHYTEMSSKK